MNWLCTHLVITFVVVCAVQVLSHWWVILGMGRYVSQLGEQHALPGSVSKDEAGGRFDE